jgi:hypothetical protein
MRHTISLVLAAVLSAAAPALGQSPATTTDAPREATTSQAPTAPPADAQPADALKPEGVRVGDYVSTGAFEIGYRFTSVDGSVDSYRSQVDEPQGPVLSFSRVELRSPENTGLLFDDLLVEGSGFFGDPNSSARVRATKRGLYVLDVTDRTVDTFNFVPDFANPLFERGVVLSPHGWDRRRRMDHVHLELFPKQRIEGHFDYDRSSQSGLGLGTEINDESLIFDRALDNTAHEVSGGVSFRWPKWFLQLEQGVRFFDDDETDTADPTVVTDPETLASFHRFRTTEVTAPTSRAVFTASPFGSLKVTARLLYTDYRVRGTLDELLDNVGSDPSPVVTTSRTDGHSFLFDSGQSYTLFDRFRLSNFVWYRRTRTAGDSNLQFTVVSTDTVGEEDRILTGYRNAWLSDTPQLEVDVTKNLVLRAGYTFGRRHSFFSFDKRVFAIPGGAPTGSEASLDSDEERLDVFSAGGSYRLKHDARLYVDYENGRAPSTFFNAEDGVFFWEKPGDFQRLRVRGMIRPRSWLELLGTVRTFDRTWHSEPLLEDFDPPLQQSRSRAAGVTFRLTPSSRYDFGVTYDRVLSTAGISYFTAVDNGDGTFETRSVYTRYDDRENLVTADFVAYPTSRLTLIGLYSLTQASGNLPVHYQQGQLRGLYSIGRGISGVLEWRLYNYDDHRYSLTDYRANLTTVGLRWEW